MSTKKNDEYFAMVFPLMTMDLAEYTDQYGPLQESEAKRVFRDLCDAVG